MTKTNIKASNSNMSDKLYKLSDFIPEFSQFRTNEDKTRIGCPSIDNSFQSFLNFELMRIKLELDVLLLIILCLFQLEKVKSILSQ